MANYDLLFKKGIIAEWYLRPDQFDLYDLIADKEKTVTNCHRRWGKSSVAFSYINETCLSDTIKVRIGGVTMKAMGDIYSNIQDHIFQYAPKFRPKYYTSEGCYIFKETGSRV